MFQDSEDAYLEQMTDRLLDAALGTLSHAYIDSTTQFPRLGNRLREKSHCIHDLAGKISHLVRLDASHPEDPLASHSLRTANSVQWSWEGPLVQAPGKLPLHAILFVESKQGAYSRAWRSKDLLPSLYYWFLGAGKTPTVASDWVVSWLRAEKRE